MKTMMYKSLALAAMFIFLAGVASAGVTDKKPEKNPLYRTCPRAMELSIERTAPDAIIKNQPQKRVDRNLGIQQLPLKVRKMEKLKR